ncbi:MULTISPECIES: carbohydrate ABC transporter permease [Pseudonocardia]|uniref:sn-glycerol-3-phosphate transport system permease protein UgpA n=2 Tax=Pseudonocardia TaxID=1847 RepID=A0A1Y2N3U8_PSEAH|nr:MULTISPECIES: sugar ABC transporter permease [Pseudonocardia]OSY42152.1 sn-glycerol-3-phosphate transport system permease protein UgpA [Pseudonocardia autotrophica]TDN75080.1 carbohydrate ABC transporter membrane protein 1 (CUT1 family) [Pseudonocardia autotrophica]BBF99024.1 sugar ABC transporter permease [Pseudonocardia autotrophica]GEC23944.1 sugar ABC transporter permease [Pseudonocardia saturnea]
MSAPSEVRRTEQTGPAGAAEPASRRRRVPPGVWFVLPFMLSYVAFVIWPLTRGLWMSFHDTSLVRSGSEFVGLDNYTRLFADPLVWSSLWTTLVFTIGSTIPLVLIALVMALLVHAGGRGQWFWRLAFFAPYLMPVATVALIWNWLFQNDVGLLNGLLGVLGMQPVGWTSDPSVALWSVVLLTVWWTVGFNFLLYLAALQAIPPDVLEAAATDGAGRWRTTRSIVLPLIAPTTGLVLVLQLLASLKLFDQAYILFSGDGGPEGSVTPVLQYVYDTGFVGYRLGYASAISYVFFLLILVIALAHAWLAGRRRSA